MPLIWCLLCTRGSGEIGTRQMRQNTTRTRTNEYLPQVMILCRVGAFRTSWLVDVRGSLVPERPWVATPYMCLCAAHGDNLSMNGNIRRLLSLGLGTPSRAALEGFVYGRVGGCSSDTLGCWCW